MIRLSSLTLCQYRKETNIVLLLVAINQWWDKDIYVSYYSIDNSILSRPTFGVKSLNFPGCIVTFLQFQ